MYRIFRLSEKSAEIRVEDVRPLNFFIQLADTMRNQLASAKEVINTEDSVVIFFESFNSVDLEKVNLICQTFNYHEPSIQEQNIVHIPCHYTTEQTDLEALASKLNLTPEEVIHLHTSGTYLLAMYGFMPGFGYFKRLDERLVVPRKATPSIRIAPGSVAIAAGYTGIYPAESPGGWYVLGHTRIKLFDSNTGHLPEIQPGDWVRFEAIDKATYAEG